jgi:hypothetical protein
MEILQHAGLYKCYEQFMQTQQPQSGGYKDAEVLNLAGITGDCDTPNTCLCLTLVPKCASRYSMGRSSGFSEFWPATLIVPPKNMQAVSA